MAVPGSPRNPAAEGTNQLLIDGAPPVVAAIDVLLHLGLSTASARRSHRAEPAGDLGSPGARPMGARAARRREQRDFDTLVRLSGRPLVEVVGAVDAARRRRPHRATGRLVRAGSPAMQGTGAREGRTAKVRLSGAGGASARTTP